MTCGCADGATPRLTDLDTGAVVRLHHHPAHVHEHAHSHDPRHRDQIHADGHTIILQEAVLAKNNRLAEQNRHWFHTHRILALNLVSSPGSGKTSLLEYTIRDLLPTLPIHVIEGDQDTTADAERIRQTGCRVVQINTGAGCHLEANMVARAIDQLSPPSDSVVMIENVGNLVCPALFDLGEQAKVVILSVTEGEDKPLKYPHMFRAATVLLLTKIDLLPHLAFDVRRCIDHAKTVNPDLVIFLVSAKTSEGLQSWYGWLQEQHKKRLAIAT